MNYNTENILIINKLKSELDQLIPFSEENKKKLQKKQDLNLIIIQIILKETP